MGSHRDGRSSYGRIVRTGKKVYHPKEPVTQEERVDWAASRVRSMRSRVQHHPDDPTLQLALASRVAEYQRERTALDRLTTRAT